MALKNRTSQVPIERTLSRIESVLVRGGATSVSRDYDEGGHISAFMFSAKVDGRLLYFRLPANVDAVYRVMSEDIRRPRAGTGERLREQALRTAWALMRDWAEIQMSLVEMGQAEIVQVFLPYVWDGQETLYTRLKDAQFKLLPEHK